MSSNLKVNTILPSVGSNIGIGTNSGELNVDGGCKVQVGTALTLGHSIGLQYATQNLHSEGFEINQINASGIITASQGIHIDDSIVHIGDNSKIRFPSNDTITFETSGSEKLRITSTGVVQIDQGTAGGNHFKIVNDEISLLAGVNGTGDTYAREAFFGTTRVDSGSLPFLRIAGQGGIKFCVDANSERLRIDSSGTLKLNQADSMIMTNADTSRLRLFGGSVNSVSNGAVLTLHGVNHSSGNYADLAAATGGSIRFRVGTSEKVRISSGGSVGVSHDLTGTSNYNRLMLHNPHDGSCWLQMTSTASGSGANTDGLSIGLNSSNIAHIWQRENAKMMFATNGTSRMEISANGIVTKPNTPAFRAHDSNHAQNGFLTFDQIATNVGSHYNGSNGRFTVPIAGTYFFSFYGMLASSNGNARVEYYINGSVHSSGEHYGGVAYTNNQTYNMITCNTVLTLSANDYVNLNWNTSYNNMHSYHNGFMGFLIG